MKFITKLVEFLNEFHPDHEILIYIIIELINKV